MRTPAVSGIKSVVVVRGVITSMPFSLLGFLLINYSDFNLLGWLGRQLIDMALESKHATNHTTSH
jgi:hypothetical protein